jgi:hypothetical protein
LVPLFPGTYTFKASGNVSGRHLTNKTTIDVGSDSSDVDLSLKSLSFTVTGNPGAVVYLNDKKIGKINKSGELKVNNYSENGNMELYATMKVDGKTVKSDTIDVEDQVSDDGSSTITPTFSGMVTEDQAQSLLQSAYDETESGSEGSSSADDFVGEEDNSSYNELLEFFDSFSEDESWDVKCQISPVLCQAAMVVRPLLTRSSIPSTKTTPKRSNNSPIKAPNCSKRW